MVRPFRTYAGLREASETSGSREPSRYGRRLLGKIALMLFVIAAWVSLTAAGRLVPMHLATTMLFWSFAPCVQIAAIGIAVRVTAPREPLSRALTLYFMGHGPWFLLLFALAAICFFAPNVYPTMTKLAGVGVLPAMLVGTFAWGVVITAALFRRGLALTRAKAALGTTLFYVLYVLMIMSYYHLTDQLRPQFIGVPP